LQRENRNSAFSIDSQAFDTNNENNYDNYEENVEENIEANNDEYNEENINVNDNIVNDENNALNYFDNDENENENERIIISHSSRGEQTPSSENSAIESENNSRSNSRQLNSSERRNDLEYPFDQEILRISSGSGNVPLENLPRTPTLPNTPPFSSIVPTDIQFMKEYTVPPTIYHRFEEARNDRISVNSLKETMTYFKPIRSVPITPFNA